MSGIRVACVCGQYGSAMGLLPVIRVGVGSLGWQMSSLTYGESIAAFESEGVPAKACKDINLSVSDAIAWLNETHPHVIILASDASRHVEKNFIRAAAILHIPSIMYIDYWSNYERRLADSEGRVDPDRVAVIDENMALDVAGVGVSSARIQIVGSPALESVSKAIENVGTIERQTLRAAHNIADDSICVLFLSSPASELDFGDSPYKEKRLHSLWPVVEDIAKDLSLIQRSYNLSTYLLVRPHPREAVTSFQQLGDRGIRLTVSSDCSSFEALCIADLVIGLDSIMLLEAVLAKKPVLSLGYVRSLNKTMEALMSSTGSLVSSRAEFHSAFLNRLLGEETYNDCKIMTLAKNATDRMIELILQSRYM